jgi:hypothetical protein
MAPMSADLPAIAERIADLERARTIALENGWFGLALDIEASIVAAREELASGEQRLWNCCLE